MVLTAEEQEDIWKAIVEKVPEDFGITGKLWTLGRTRQYIQKQFRKAVNERTLSDYMKRWGMSSQRPAKRTWKQDPQGIGRQRLIRFMERLIRTSKQKVFLILDNLKVHHGKLAAAWLEKNREKIEVFFLPPYALEYNPDEYWNHALKISVHSGQLPYTTEDISHKIQSFMRRLQHCPSAVSAFFFHPSLSYLFLQK